MNTLRPVKKQRTQPSFTFKNLPKDILKEIISHLFQHSLALCDRCLVTKLSLVCKNWQQIEKDIFLENQGSKMAKMMERIRKSKTLGPSEEEKMLITQYQSCQEQLINKWLSHQTSNPELLNAEMKKILDEKFSSSTNLLVDLIKEKEFDIAFAYAMHRDTCSNNLMNQTIQKYLIEEYGYQQAWMITLAHKNNDTLVFASYSFLKVGACLLNISSFFDKEGNELLNAPFIKAFFHFYSTFPLNTASYNLLMDTIIYPLWDECNNNPLSKLGDVLFKFLNILPISYLYQSPYSLTNSEL